jgi:hypothetical protein
MRKKVIYREDGEPYLIRWYLFRCKRFQICLHHILLSDYDCLHDHPWKFITLILKGGYYERIPRYDRLFKTELGNTIDNILNGRIIANEVVKKWYGPGSLLGRPAKWKHALELPEGKTAWSLLIMFKKERDWGFWTSKGWVYYEAYKPTQSCE